MKKKHRRGKRLSTLALLSDVKKAKVIAYALDPWMYATNRRILGCKKWTMHAEARLIRKIKARHLRVSTIYVARWSTRNGWTMARPCSQCQKLLQGYRVFYTGWDGTYHEA